MSETEKQKQIRRLKRKIKKFTDEGQDSEKIEALRTKLRTLENEEDHVNETPSSESVTISSGTGVRIPSNAKAIAGAQKLVTHFRDKGVAIATLSEKRINSEVRDWIPTGILGVDYIMGGGFPTGRVVEVFGEEASFKTGLGLSALDNCILMNGIAILQDTEQAFDRAKVRHPDSPAFIYKDDQILEEFWAYTVEALGMIRDEDALSLLLWDSLPSTLPKSVFDEEVGKANYGKGAKLNSENIPVAQRTVKQANCCFVINNQIRSKMNPGYGEDKYDTPGGHAVRFYASIRLEMSSKAKFWYDGDSAKKKGLPPDGFMVEAYTKKNKLTSPFQRARFPVVFKDHRGADPADAAYEFLKDKGIIEVNGGWSSFPGMERKFYRKDWADIYPDLIEDIWNLCEERLDFAYSEKAKAALRLATYEIYGRPIPEYIKKQMEEEARQEEEAERKANEQEAEKPEEEEEPAPTV